ncbi:VOC family protein [Aestuariibacter sp. AA17]|uniref:VOC family protein n=1 Tax=Fluctibacter corallii TaxID=2984329 RepID=A0ABT3A963_9ALTE|nr:VOC family protein [Aestuariibacter sp. AA17]MCV2885163.1 VOC family protein [Aestuariibacter sp. AA17]
MSQYKPGEMGWLDLTVDDATTLKSFYQNVLNWHATPVKMGDYADYSMSVDRESDPVSGICYKRGENADMPSVWMPYFIVEDLDAAIDKVTQQGGEIVSKIKGFGSSRYVVIKDPAGAVCSIYQQ